jgi:hypothetical protein
MCPPAEPSDVVAPLRDSPPERRWLTPAQAAAHLDVTLDELIRLVTDARLIAHRLPTGALVFSLTDLDALLTPVPADEAAGLLTNLLSQEKSVLDIAPAGATHADLRGALTLPQSAPGRLRANAAFASPNIPSHLGHLLTMDEICDFAQIHPATLYRYIAMGLRSFQAKPGHARRYLLADVLRFMSRQTTVPPEPPTTPSAIADDNELPPDLFDHIRDVAD